MEAIFLKIFNMGITAGWLILAVIACRFLFRKASKQIRCLLWGLVALRLCCPVSVESVFSLLPSTQTVVYQENTAEGNIADIKIESGVELFDQPVNASIQKHMPKEQVVSKRNGINPIRAASLVWIMGVVLFLGYGLLSYWKVWKMIRVSIVVDSKEAKDRVYVCDDIPTPFIFGIIRPGIYLPSEVSKEQVPYILAHERVHLKRHDHWWKPLGFLLLSIYWFQPLVWLAYFLLCKDIELACDEKVIQDMGIRERQAYSHALLSNCISHREMLAYPLAFGEVGIKERIKSVMKYKEPASWLMGMAVVSCIVVAACFLTNPKNTKLQGATEVAVTEQKQENNKEWEQQEKDANAFALNPTVNLSVSLGADGARLNYADGERIILSCSPYLMVYSKTDKKMLRVLDLKAIGCDKTQGDSACEIAVTEDGDTVYLHPMDQKVMFEYDIANNELETYDSEYSRDFIEEEKRQGRIHEVDNVVEVYENHFNYTDYFQKDGKTMYTSIWGRDTVGSLVWREGLADEDAKRDALSYSDIYHPFFLTKERESAVQFTPSDIHDLVKVEMFIDGQMKSCTDKKALKYVEEHMGGAVLKEKILLKPYYFPMYLTRKDGTVGIVYPSVYGEGNFSANGSVYLLAGVEAYENQDAKDEYERYQDGKSRLFKEFWAQFEGWFENL